MTREHDRLEENRTGSAPWHAWGPYLSERQWGTVREDYSPGGDAWDYFPHEHARSRAYRFGEDGIAGISDDRQRLCFALAMWNGADPILKERMFGLTNGEGNHGEDVKEYWFYLDSTPTHSYMKSLYKYPQREFPYADLVSTNAARSRDEFEYELIDTGIFADDRYFDVFCEYAKAAPDDILVEVTAHNRGPDRATLELLPTLWFRNTWAWSSGGAVPSLERTAPGDAASVRATHHELGEWLLYCEEGAELLFCENETNNERVFGTPNVAAHVKDGINDHVVDGVGDAVNPEGRGTKVSARHELVLEPGAHARVRLRLVAASGRPAGAEPLGGDFDRVLQARRTEADEFYATVIGPSARCGPDQRGAPGVRRPALGQAVLRVRRAPLARRARHQPLVRGGPQRRPAQRRVVPPRRGRRDLDARQVGVPVVRRVGPRVADGAARPRRHRLRQGSDGAPAGRPLPAPERPDPGLRVELLRRQPPAPRVGRGPAVRARAAGSAERPIPSSSDGSSSGS